MRHSDRRRVIRVLSAVLVALALVLVTGCTVPGRPIGQYPDPTALDVGAYSIHPLDEPTGNERYGRVVEAARMAEALIDPVEADPTLTLAVGGDGVMLMPTTAKATILLAAPVRAVLERNGMVTGCAVGGTDKDPPQHGPVVGQARVLMVITLRFPDAPAAQRAAREIDDVDKAMSPENVSVPIPGYPAAAAHWRPTVPSMAATIAEGPYVVSLIAGHTATDSEALTGLARKAFDAQLPRLREFVPTPADQLATLSLDHEGMLRRIAPEAPGRWPYPKVIVTNPQRVANWNQVIRGEGIVYGPRGTRLWNGRIHQERPIEWEAVNGMTQLQRYSTAVAARRAFEEMKSSMTQGFGIVEGPQGVPEVFCVETPGSVSDGRSAFTCRMVYGRYLGMLIGNDLKNLRQRTALQLALLVNAGD
ncbi:hypothetical protein AB0N05_26395 [Nocardia sp. NPDC051030]|uniref:DUF7373 family lipoprotein n=1 Tax=Nocardia sp. NPDC051030 TaxID=3155162 RepID=UPI00343E344D